MLVVVNDRLMDNHQIELAEEMGAKDYLCYAESPEDLETCLKQSEHKLDSLSHYPTPDPKPFYKLIEEEIGINPVYPRIYEKSD